MFKIICVHLRVSALHLRLKIKRFPIITKILLFAISLISCLLGHTLTTHSIAIAIDKGVAQNSYQLIAANSENSLGDEGSIRYNAGQYREAIALWQESLTQTSDRKQKAIIHTNLGTAYRQIGELGEAISNWEKAAKIYQSFSDSESRRFLAQVLTEQAQAYNALGQFRQAMPILQSAVDLARKNQDRTTEVAAQGALGNAYSAAGELDKAIAAYQASLNLATTLKNSSLIGANLNNLGSVFNRRYQRYLLQANAAEREGDDKEKNHLMDLAQQDAASARSNYERALEASKSLGGIPHAKALLNLAQFLQQLPTPKTDAIGNYYTQAIALLDATPDSRPKAYALISAAEIIGNANRNNQQLKAQTLQKAIGITRNIGDKRAESFAVGALGKVYEQAQNWEAAMQLTQQAALAAQQANAADSLYRWQSQTGRIYKAQGQNELAIASYKEVIVTLQSIRSDLAAASKDLQFDLRDSVEPVYRELIALLLNESEKYSGDDAKSKIEDALQVVELLQLAELQNFFGDECTEVARDKSDPKSVIAKTNTAVINSIILRDRTYLILSLPDGSVKRYEVGISHQEMEKKIDRLRFTLEDISTDEYLLESQKVYDWLIAPMAADLEKAKPSTLLFINDGVLRNVPMAALYDGKKYLVEKYAIATTLGLHLTSNKKSDLANANALIFGLSAEIPPFAPLPNVPKETQDIQEIVGGKRFLDKDFTLANLEKQINKGNYPIVHLATHGKFGADPNSTFLQVFDRRVSLNEFEKVLRQSKHPIELLTLSACQTAAGNDRSTLGIAGVALRSGVQTTFASLWFVNDADTLPLIENFYKLLQQPGVTKAEALRQSQMKLIADPNGHPAIWSPFVLVGNWQ
nr:CHAT domain-containing protein [Argonema antarcticum]